MRPQDLIKDDKVDVTDHHSAEGELYLPSSPWGIMCLIDWNKDKPVSSEARRALSDAIDKANSWVENGSGDRSAIVFNRKTGRVAHVVGY